MLVEDRRLPASNRCGRKNCLEQPVVAQAFLLYRPPFCLQISQYNFLGSSLYMNTMLSPILPIMLSKIVRINLYYVLHQIPLIMEAPRFPAQSVARFIGLGSLFGSGFTCFRLQGQGFRPRYAALEVGSHRNAVSPNGLQEVGVRVGLPGFVPVSLGPGRVRVQRFQASKPPSNTGFWVDSMPASQPFAWR